jgi:hypothetical protein
MKAFAADQIPMEPADAIFHLPLPKIYYSPNPSPINIYKVEKDGLKPHIKLDFGYKSLENAENQMERTELLRHYKEHGLFKSIGNLFIFKDFTYFQIFSDKSFRCIAEGNIVFLLLFRRCTPKLV